MKKLISLCLIAFTSSQAMAWGERGHNAVARVAARLVASSKDPETAAFGAILQKREHMLGHLANVPDIVWRSDDPAVKAANAPSHFVDLEYILPESGKLTARECPADFEAYRKAIANNCSKKQLSCAPGETENDKLSKAGHAPFRIQALSQELTKTLAETKNAKAEARSALIDKALLYSGILAHFVGDLANPHHTSSDYDGWHSDQGGLHGYFETDQVDAQGLDLEASMFAAALKDQPAQKIFGKDRDPLLMAWDLTIESHARIPALLELDRKNSLVKKSSNTLRTKAERKPSAAVANAYHDFLIERLSIGADALATVWIAAWEAAGRPKLDGYQSLSYPVKPDFIPLGYWSSVVVSQSANKPNL